MRREKTDTCQNYGTYSCYIYCPNTHESHPDGDSKAVLTHAVISKNSKAAHVPAFFLSNAMSLAPKIDEVREVVRRGKFQFISIVEI
jgi:hypothetical protein